MARTIVDENFMSWEVYVSGGQPNTAETARIFFLCLDAPMNPARFVSHEGRSVVAAERTLIEATDGELREMLARSVANE